MDFSRTFKALNFDFQIQGLSRTFKVSANPVYTSILYTSILLSAIYLICIFEAF